MRLTGNYITTDFASCKSASPFKSAVYTVYVVFIKLGVVPKDIFFPICVRMCNNFITIYIAFSMRILYVNKISDKLKIRQTRTLM